MQYQPKEFTIPKLEGISEKQIEVHLGLYRGYVTHVNTLREQIAELKEADEAKYQYAINETRRRLGFEFNGMRMHEYYFEQFPTSPRLRGASENIPNESSPIAQALAEKYGSWNGFIKHIQEVAGSRGIGWVVLYWDAQEKTPACAGRPHVAWVNEHEIGTLAGAPILLAIDMWEHAFMVDHVPAEKTHYLDAVLTNINWQVVEERFANI